MRHRRNPREYPVNNSGGDYMFNAHQTNQHQPGWEFGQVQYVAMQQQHLALLQQQQQQQQRRPQYQQHQTQWGTVITSGTTVPLIGQQQHQQQQLQQPQQQLQPWGGPYAQSQSQQQQQPPLQVAQFNPSVIQPQHHIVQVQSNHQNTPLGQQHTLQSIHTTNPSQPYPTPQSWTPHLPTAQGQPLANGALPLPRGQQPRRRRTSPTAGSIWSPKTGSISSSSSSYNGNRTLVKGGASSHRNPFSLGTPPSPSRHDGVSNKRARKRKSRATGTAPSSENEVASRASDVAIKEGNGISASLDEIDSRDNNGEVPRVQPCEPCEREFNSESARKAHLESHVTCKEDGCEFSALPKVMNYHHEIKHGQYSGSGFQMIDVEGQKFRVLLGTCPEQAEQWRAARRKHWPTKANISRKNEQMKKRKQLGDLGTDTGIAGRGRGKGRGKGRGRGGPPILELASTDDAKKNVENVVEGLEKGAPAKTEPLGEGGVSETGNGVEGLEGGDGARKVKKRFCSFYLKKKCRNGDACTFSHDAEQRTCSYFMKGKCVRGKACPFIHDSEARAKAKRESSDAVVSDSEKPHKKRAAKRLKAERDAMRQVESKPTLLRNLLAPQLHRESSIALQAVRFIVGSNFLLAPVPAKADGETSPSEAATAAVDTADTCDAVSPSNDRSESQNPVKEDEPHTMGVTGSAESAVTPKVGCGADVDPETVINHAVLSATGNMDKGLSPENQNRDNAGSVQSGVREDQTGCVESDAVVAECAKDNRDSAAVTDAVTNGLLSGDLAGNIQSRVEEDEVQMVKAGPGRTAVVPEVDHLEGGDVSTEGSTAAVPTVASGSKVDECQVSDHAGIKKGCIEDKNTQAAVGNESVVSSAVSGMTGGDIVMGSRDIEAVSTSTDGVLPDEKRGDAVYSSPSRHAEDKKPQETVGEGSLVPKATDPSVVVGADIAGQGVVVAGTDGLPQGKDGDVDVDCGGQNRVEEENKVVGIPSPVTAVSCDAAAPATSSIDIPPMT